MNNFEKYYSPAQIRWPPQICSVLALCWTRRNSANGPMTVLPVLHSELKSSPSSCPECSWHCTPMPTHLFRYFFLLCFIIIWFYFIAGYLGFSKLKIPLISKIIVVGQTSDATTQNMLRTIQAKYLPMGTVIFIDKDREGWCNVQLIA